MEQPRPKKTWVLMAIGILVAVGSIWAMCALDDDNISDVLTSEWEAGDRDVSGIVGKTHQISPGVTGVNFELSFWENVAGLGRTISGCDSDSPDVLVAGNVSQGQQLTTTLQFRAYDLDGIPVIIAPTLLCPFPLLHNAIGEVVDSVSLVQGTQVIPVSFDGEWATFMLQRSNNPAINWNTSIIEFHGMDRTIPISSSGAMSGNPELVPLTSEDWPVNSVQKWQRLAAGDFTVFSDEMAGNRHLGTWAGSDTEFVKVVDRDGVISDGDLVRVRVGPLANDELRTHTIRIAACPHDDCIIATKLFIADQGGPIVGPDQVPGFSVRMAESSKTQSTLTWHSFTPQPIANFVIELTGPMGFAKSNLATNASLGDATISFTDVDADGLASNGDKITITHALGEYRASIRHIPSNSLTAAVAWTAGFGPHSTPEPIVTLHQESPDRYRVNVTWSATTLPLQWITMEVIGNSVSPPDTLFGDGWQARLVDDGDDLLGNGDYVEVTGDSGANYSFSIGGLGFGTGLSGVIE